MNTSPVSYKRHRFPSQIIAHAVWLYFRFPLSLRLVEELLLERGIAVSNERTRGAKRLQLRAFLGFDVVLTGGFADRLNLTFRATGTCRSVLEPVSGRNCRFPVRIGPVLV